MRIDLADFNNTKKFAKYSHFSVGSEQENFKLRIDGFTGNIGKKCSTQGAIIFQFL